MIRLFGYRDIRHPIEPFPGHGALTGMLSGSFLDQKVAWYENTSGDGSAWTEQGISSGVGGVSALFAVDLDDDGDTDVLSAFEDDDMLSWHENTAGDGSAWTA